MKQIDDNGSITKNILRLSWPLMLGMFFQTMFNVVDAIYLGWYSAEALAAISITFSVIFLLIAFSSGLSVGITSLIARKLGEKKNAEANNAAEHGLMLGLAIGLIVTAVGLMVSKPLFVFIGTSDTLMPMVLDFANITFAFSIFLFGSFVVNSIQRGEGNMKVAMRSMIIATIINIILEPIFIFGFWFVPEMGVKGAAIATVIARAFSFFYSLYFLFYGKNVLKIQLKYFKYKWSIIKEILLIGLPASFSQSFMSIGMILMTKMVATYGDMAIAAFGIVGRLDSVAILPVIGVSTAAITLVGYHVGAKNYKRAEEITLKASLLAFLFGTFVGLIYFFFTKPIIGIFTNNPEITAISIAYLKIIALFTGISAVPFVIYSAFQGAGMAFPSLVLIFIRMFLLVIPFAYFFSIYLGYGIHFLWWAWPFSSVINALISVIWFRRGTWKRDCKGKMICY